MLIRSDLLDVVAALHLSRTIFSVIKRNLIWACIYNVIGIPLAMGFFLPLGLYMHPMIAGGAMAFSSVSVVMSSLMLKWWTRPTDSIMPDEMGARVALPPTMDGNAGWTGMFLDGTTSVLDSARVMLFSERRMAGDYRYSQLPVEMENRNVV